MLAAFCHMYKYLLYDGVKKVQIPLETVVKQPGDK